MAEGPRRRLRLLSTLLMALTFVVIFRLVHVQIVRHSAYAQQAETVQRGTIDLPVPPRGVVRDRTGHLLAGNEVLYSIEASPNVVTNPITVASLLEAQVHVPASRIRALLEQDTCPSDLDPDASGTPPPCLWVRIVSPVSKEVGEQVAKLELAGITARPLWQRAYPERTLASHLLGFCNFDGEGHYGVEGFYESLLAPERLEWTGSLDITGKELPWEVVPLVLPKPGTDLQLTIDRTVQAAAEEELARSVVEYQAEGGTIIVMDPRTFGVLALASLPNYDPGRFYDFFSKYEDPAVAQQFEPGSVFKILTVAGALEDGKVTPETTYNDLGYIEVGGQTIRNAHDRTWGEQTVADILIESLNVGAAWLSTQMGAEVFYQYVQAFGIGRPSRVDLAGEIGGQLWLPDDLEHWHDSNLGTNSFGQGVAVTPLQMVSAVAVVANDGMAMRPHVVGRRIAPDGQVSVFQPVDETRVISPETARTVTEILVRTLEEGIPKARVEGYRLAGKTGTAQIPIPGGYEKEDTIASFIGFGPVPDPELIILVKLDRPKTSRWAISTSALAFQRLAKRLFVVLRIPPESGPTAEGVR